MTTLPQLLRDSASARPESIAVADPERGVEMTYRELQTRAEKLSEDMIRHGVRPRDRVGIYAPKSVGTVAALLGTLYSRGAYVPVDCSAPPARNAGIFADASIRLAVVAESLLEGFRGAWDARSLDVLEPLGDGLVLVRGVDAEGDSVADTNARATPADVAYILYTSGSTGKPKGVVHTHQSALSFIDWCSEAFTPTAADRFSSHAPFHFDLSILDLYVPLKHGATVVLIGEELGKQPLRLAPVIAASGITVWYSTPSILRVLAEYGRLDRLEFPSLRTVLFAGEVFPVKHLRALKKIWRVPRFFNLYGPTETNVCTYYEIPDEIPDDRTEPFPIGFTCSGDRAIVADESGREVAKGEEGELLVTGGSVMREYWNLPARTAQAFYIDAGGTAWYRTGDVVRESSTDGYIFVGRRDRMVKRRGYRVELGEIEAALYRHPLVTEAAVAAVPDEENGVSIRAFLSLSTANRPSLVEMKRFCIEHLPAYMVPDKFYFPESLPKTSTDKIDYQRLLATV